MRSYPLLDKIQSPKDVKALREEELPQLAREIRAFLVDHVTLTGGHLSSNLGVVELTIAMHRVFSSPRDHFIFDVGHQSYVHKLLTGRRDAFDTLRQNGGLSGFTKRSESEHDPFGAGHASTSLSAAIGMATADAIAGSDAYTVCVIGDGAFTGGMIHEALNNVPKDLRLIIILNENEMSISQITGKYAKHLSKLRTSHTYYDVKNSTRAVLSKIPHIGVPLTNKIQDIKQSLKNFVYHSNYFEDLGLYYLGPANGNDVGSTETLLRVAKQAVSTPNDDSDSVVVHLKTTKGKGWKPAEREPDVFHGVPAMKYHTAKPKTNETSMSFSYVFGDTMLSLLKSHKNMRVITAAMADGTGLQRVAKELPESLIDVGIAEEHAVTYAAGLSAGGVHPVVALYSTFLQRAYDNVIHDVALQELPMTFCIDRAGFNDSDGPTHHGIFDVAMITSMPNITMYTPISYDGLRAVLKDCALCDRITAIRYARGSENEALCAHFAPYRKGAIAPITADFDPIKETPDALIVSYGNITNEAILAKEMLQKDGISVGILLLEQLTPIADRANDIIAYLSENTRLVLFLEEGVYAGGLSMQLADALDAFLFAKQIPHAIHAIRNPFAPSERGKRMIETAGLSAEYICDTVKTKLR